MKKFNVVAGLDIGNGYVKGGISLNGGFVETVYTPSSVSYSNAKTLPWEVNKENLEDFVNKMDLHVTSPLIDIIDEGRIFFGSRGVMSGSNIRTFDISNDTPKCKDALSIMLITGVIAGSVIEQHFKISGNVDSDIEIDVNLATALPIQDFIEYRQSYERDLKSDVHIVTIHNFEKTIIVKINFKNVLVVPEGAAAQFAINNFSENQIIKVCNDSNISNPSIMKSATSTIGVDIGEGTVNFPVFLNSKVSSELSRSIDVGYGTILSRVIESTRDKNGAFKSRKQLSEFMQSDVSTLSESKQAIYSMYDKYIKDELKNFLREIYAEFNKIFSEVGPQTDVIYVYGGGSAPMREILQPTLIKASRVGDIALPVIYISESYSNMLNRNGLFDLALKLK